MAILGEMRADQYDRVWIFTTTEWVRFHQNPNGEQATVDDIIYRMPKFEPQEDPTSNFFYDMIQEQEIAMPCLS